MKGILNPPVTKYRVRLGQKNVIGIRIQTLLCLRSIMIIYENCVISCFSLYVLTLLTVLTLACCFCVLLFAFPIILFFMIVFIVLYFIFKFPLEKV